MCKRELETEQRLQHIDPNSSGYHSLSFSFSLAAQSGGSHSSIFSPTNLNFLSPGLYNNLTSTYFLLVSQFRTQFNPSTVKVAPALLISSTGCTCYLHRCICYFDSLAGSEVNMQQSWHKKCVLYVYIFLSIDIIFLLYLIIKSPQYWG